MKLIANKADEYQGKAYYKYLAVFPTKLIKKLGWKKGDELDAEIEGNKLVIKRKK